MADHSKNGIQGLINALELVAPAVDPSDPIAAEQLQSAVRYLQFLRDRLDLLYDRERFELRHHLDMGARLVAAVGGDPGLGHLVARLATQETAGRALLARAGANVPEMRACTAELAATMAALVTSAADGDPDTRTTIERIVLDATAERIVFERAWYLPLGFDHSPADVPPIATVIAGERAAHGSPAGAPHG